MSAWLVPSSHIGAMVRFFVVDAGPMDRPYWKNQQVTEEHAVDLLALLAFENLRSVSFRYQDSRDSDGDLPGPCGNGGCPVVCDPDLYLYKALTPLQALKACDCYEYQSCEHDEWESSDAAKLVNAIRRSAIHRLPGWGDADAWPVDELAGPYDPRPLLSLLPRRRGRK